MLRTTEQRDIVIKRQCQEYDVLKLAIPENEIQAAIDGSLDNFLKNTENHWIEELRAAKNRKWSRRIHQRIPAKSLIRVLDGETEKKQKLNKVHNVLLQDKLDVFLSHSSNQYSSQIKNKAIDPATVLVIDKEFEQTTITPLAEKSTLLGSEAKQIAIWQLYVLRENYDQAIKLIQNQLI